MKQLKLIMINLEGKIMKTFNEYLEALSNYPERKDLYDKWAVTIVPNINFDKHQAYWTPPDFHYSSCDTYQFQMQN